MTALANFEDQSVALSVQCLNFLVKDCPFSRAVFLKTLQFDEGAWIPYIALCIQSFKERGKDITVDHEKVILEFPYTYSLFNSRCFVSEEMKNRFIVEPSYFVYLLKNHSNEFTVFSCENARQELCCILLPNASQYDSRARIGVVS